MPPVPRGNFIRCRALWEKSDIPKELKEKILAELDHSLSGVPDTWSRPMFRVDLRGDPANPTPGVWAWDSRHARMKTNRYDDLHLADDPYLVECARWRKALGDARKPRALRQAARGGHTGVWPCASAPFSVSFWRIDVYTAMG